MFFTSKFSEKVRPSSSWWLSSWRVNSWQRMEFNPLLSGCMEASWERPGARATFHHHPVCSRDSARSTNKDTHVCCCFPGVCVCLCVFVYIILLVSAEGLLIILSWGSHLPGECGWLACGYSLSPIPPLHHSTHTQMSHTKLHRTRIVHTGKGRYG